MKEIISLRKPREKHFLNEDGTFKVEMFANDIHYLENGEYKEIKNTLIETADYYENKTNSLKTQFSKNKPQVIIKSEDDYIEVEFENIVLDQVSTSQNEIIYHDSLHGIELKYNVHAGLIKESIVLRDENSISNELLFHIKTNLELLQENKKIQFLKNERKIFTLNSPFMIDADNNRNDNIIYELISQENNQYHFKMNMDKEWLLNDNTKFPVIIDPTILNDRYENVEDVELNSSMPNDNYGVSDCFFIGPMSSKINRALLKFKLPEINSSYNIVSAKVYLTSTPESNVLNKELQAINVHEVTNDWNEFTATWNNMHDKFDTKVRAYFYPKINRFSSEPCTSEVDITKLVKEWYSGKKNRGILLKSCNETYSNLTPCYGFYTIDYDYKNQTSYRPALTISYRIQSGVENYMNYNQVSYNNGTSYINTFNGNVVNIFETTKTLQGKYPVSLQVVHNSCDTSRDRGLGIGWKFNLDQALEKVTIDEKEYLKYINDSGSIHYFYKENNLFIDENGSNFKIKFENDNYTMTDSVGNEYLFAKINNDYKLTRIKDTSSNFISISYTGDRITKIIDGSNQEITVSYNNDNVTIMSNYDTATLKQSNSLLEKIINKFSTTTFMYQDNRIIKILESNGLSKEYLYLEENPHRLQKITEYGLNNSIGNIFNYTYGANITKVTDVTNKTSVYLFDEQGRLVNQYMTISGKEKLSEAYGGASTFLNDDISVNQTNKKSGESIPQRYVENLLFNSSFEEDKPYNFEFTNASVVAENASLGNRSLKLLSNNKSTILFNINEKDIYTVSFDLKVLEENSVTCNLYEEQNNTKTLQSSYLISKDNNNGEYSRVSLTGDFNVNSKLIIEILQSNNNSQSFLDNIQIEHGNVANVYNMVSNSSFKQGINYWLAEGSKFDGTEMPQVYTIDTLPSGEKAFHLLGDTYGGSSLSQTFSIPGKKGDIYHVSFWYKSEGLYESDGYFGNIVNLQFFNTNEEAGMGTRNLPLNPNINEWQYFNASFVAECDYTGFSFNFISGMEPNGFSITNVMLNKDLSEIYYQYDNEGNLIGITDLSNQTNKFEYNKNNQLIASFNPKGNHFSYEYDNKITDRLLKAISPTGISNEIKYDEHGNPIKTIINNVNIDGEVVTNKLYHIRLKGTELYLNYDYSEEKFKATNSNCNQAIYKLESIGNNYYYIILDNKYLTSENDKIYLSLSKTNNSSFNFHKHSNGSFYLTLRDNNSKCVAFEENELKIKEIDTTKPEVTVEASEMFYFEDINTNLYVETKAYYTDDGKYITKTQDELGNMTSYQINPTSGVTEKVTNANGVSVEYSYNNKEQVIKCKQNESEVTYEYNNQNLISNINTKNQKYSFYYDNFLNPKEVKVGNQTLITNEYESNNGNLAKSTYGNGSILNYTYDNWNRMKTSQNDTETLKYTYDNLGNLSKIDSDINHYKYYYDYAQRICSYDFNNFKIDYEYQDSNIIKKKYFLNNKKEVEYSYNKDDAIILVSFQDHKLNYEYDYLGRMKKKNIDNTLPIEYQYYTNGEKTSFTLKSMKIGEELYQYTYDKLGNIISITYNNNPFQSFMYDDYNELIEETNYILNYKVKYQYDLSGNIQRKSLYELDTECLLKEDNYEYNNDNWKDQLSKYNNQSIQYDQIGNPIKIGKQTLTWQNGRELKNIQDDKQNVSYTYDKDGIRNSKTVNGKTTNYYTENEHIIFEQQEDNMIYYIRDDENSLIGFEYNNELYYYKKNVQDDIIGIYNSNYELIANYEYDAWGKMISIKDNTGKEIISSSHIAIKNPFRYRSYYYDEETKLYYLNSRYYNPEWGRFINADGIIGTSESHLGYNLYAYCNNNPVLYADMEGTLLGIAGALGALATAAVGAVLAVGVGMLAKALQPVVSTAYKKAKAQVQSISKSLERSKTNNSNKNDNHYGVYSLWDRDKAMYVGRTNNIERRKSEHLRDLEKGKYTFIVEKEDLSYQQSRGIEEYFIMKYGTLNELNKVHGIGKYNKNQKAYYTAANNYFNDEVFVGDGLTWDIRFRK